MDGKEISFGANTFTISVQVFISKTERDSKKDEFNNLFVKNFPSASFTEDELRNTFEAFGPLLSLKIDDSKAFGFVAFENCLDA